MDNTIYENSDEFITREKKYSIGELAALLGCNKSLLRYYEEQFSIEIPRNDSNRRYYTPTEAEKFRYILRLKDNGMSNTEIKSVLNSGRIKPDDFSCAVSEDISCECNEPDDGSIKALYEIIAGLRDEINELRQNGIMRDKSELVAENEQLRRKLKEKTYELVSLREDARLNSKKRKFFR